MIRNYLRIGIRNLWKNKTYSFINIFGLAVGLACCLLIVNYVIYELSYDSFYKNKDRIYRLLIDDVTTGQVEASTPYIAGPDLKSHFGQVQNFVRFYSFWGPYSVKYKNNIFNEEKLFYTDSTLFKVFDFDFLEGSAVTVFKNPGSVVITQNIARKYFGDEDPLNKMLTIKNENNYQVTGVIKDLPDNSNFHFDFLVYNPSSLNMFPSALLNSWTFINFDSYIILSPGINGKQFETELNQYVIKKFSEQAALDQENNQDQYRIQLQPLSKIHLYSSHITGDSENRGNINYVIIFSAIALAILGIAVFNYINLSVALSFKRTRELGLRKVIGATNRQLVDQYISETFILTFIAFLTGMILAELALPYFNNMTGNSLHGIFSAEPMVLPGLFLSVIIISIISGSYLTAYSVNTSLSKILSGNFIVNQGKTSIKKLLIITQFSAAMILIICTLIIFNQLNFIQREDLGFNKEQLVGVNMNSLQVVRNYSILKNSLLSDSYIVGVAGASGIPPNAYQYSNITVIGDSTRSPVTMKNFFVTGDFINVLGLKIIKGRGFPHDFTSTKKPDLILNETAVKALGLNDPIGTELNNGWGEFNGTVVGIVKDFHFKSARDKIEPVIITHVDSTNIFNLVVRITPNNIPSTLFNMEKKWKAINPEWPFVYHFVDEDFNHLYRKDIQTGHTISFFSILALLISCVGLFGLVAFMTENRIKEIGIRKINGAGMKDILMLISGNFFRWILIAFIISAPVAYYFMFHWLRNFAYRISIHWWVFGMAGLLALFIAGITISFKTIQAARMNPVDILRYE